MALIVISNSYYCLIILPVSQSTVEGKANRCICCRSCLRSWVEKWKRQLVRFLVPLLPHQIQQKWLVWSPDKLFPPVQLHGKIVWNTNTQLCVFSAINTILSVTSGLFWLPIDRKSTRSGQRFEWRYWNQLPASPITGWPSGATGRQRRADGITFSFQHWLLHRYNWGLKVWRPFRN